MNIIMATEIWGRTAHVEAMARRICPAAHSLAIVDPYNGAAPGFETEEQAYSAYVAQGGLEQYAQHVHSTLKTTSGPVILAGFSAGAGAIWSALADETLAIVAAFCFYGSAIRNMAEQGTRVPNPAKAPAVPVELVFPEHEDHFDVPALVQKLRTFPLTTCHVVPQGHGFMNPLSSQYDAAAASKWEQWLYQSIEQTARKYRT